MLRKPPVVSRSLAMRSVLPEVQPRTGLARMMESATPASYSILTGLSCRFGRAPCAAVLLQNKVRKHSGTRSASRATMSSGETYIVPTSPPRGDGVTRSR